MEQNKDIKKEIVEELLKEIKKKTDRELLESIAINLKYVELDMEDMHNDIINVLRQ